MLSQRLHSCLEASPGQMTYIGRFAYFLVKEDLVFCSQCQSCAMLQPYRESSGFPARKFRR